MLQVEFHQNRHAVRRHGPTSVWFLSMVGEGARALGVLHCHKLLLCAVRQSQGTFSAFLKETRQRSEKFGRCIHVLGHVLSRASDSAETRGGNHCSATDFSEVAGTAPVPLPHEKRARGKGRRDFVKRPVSEPTASGQLSRGLAQLPQLHGKHAVLPAPRNSFD